MKQELYFVAVVPGEPVESEVHRFKADLNARYGTKAAMKAAVHITLFAPFRFDPNNEQLLFSALDNSVNEVSAFPVELKNFDCFAPRVIYVGVEENFSLNRLQRKVKNEFLRVPGMLARPEFTEFHPHMTIGNRDWPEGAFEKAWAEYKEKTLSAMFTAGKISLLRLDDGKWNVVREAKFVVCG